MDNTKVIKGYCTQTGQKFGLEIKWIGGEWKVVNFINLTAEEAALISSDVRQSSFKTNDNLLPCAKCGGRAVSGCSCPPTSRECRAGEYNLQCVYCNKMKIDYTAAVIGGGHREGDVIKLSQGQEVTIHSSTGGRLTKIIVGLGWDPANGDREMDVDSSVVVAGQDGFEITYFEDLKHPSGCVVHHGDNLTGETHGEDDDENITVHLDKVPSGRDRLIFVINIYECIARHQNLGDVNNLYIRLYDPIAGIPIIEYKVNGDLKNYTAMIIGMAYRKSGGWKFKALGKGSKATSIRNLATVAKNLKY